jgi:hypothetical protein
MTIARILSAGAAAAFVLFYSAAVAQEAKTEAHTGMITGINRINDTIAIRQAQSGTVGASSGGAAEEFKVQKGQSLEDLHAGDRVSFFVATEAGGLRTITKLGKP